MGGFMLETRVKAPTGAAEAEGMGEESWVLRLVCYSVANVLYAAFFTTKMQQFHLEHIKCATLGSVLSCLKGIQKSVVTEFPKSRVKTVDFAKKKSADKMQSSEKVQEHARAAFESSQSPQCIYLWRIARKSWYTLEAQSPRGSQPRWVLKK